MSIERFGEFLIRTTNGKITGENVSNALKKQEKFSDGYKKLGEILVEDNVLTKDELVEYLDKFHKEREEAS